VKTRHYRALIMLLFLPCVSAYSAITSHATEIIFGIGAPFYTDNTNNKQLQVNSVETDQLKQNQSTTLPTFHVAVSEALTFAEAANTLWGIGPHFYYQHINYSGSVYQYGVPTLDNYSYKSTAEIFDLLLEGQVRFLGLAFSVQPLLVAGVGVGYSSIDYYDYAGTGVPGGRIHTPYYYNWNAIFDVGAGLSFPFSERGSIELEYLYLYNGTITSGSGSSLLHPFSVNLNSNNIMLNIRYTVG